MLVLCPFQFKIVYISFTSAALFAACPDLDVPCCIEFSGLGKCRRYKYDLQFFHKGFHFLHPPLNDSVVIYNNFRATDKYPYKSIR